MVGTGCWAHVAGQYGLLTPDPAYPGVGDGLKAVLEAVAKANGLEALPACWHMGSCVDNSRIEDVVNTVAGYLNVVPTPLASSIGFQKLPRQCFYCDPTIKRVVVHAEKFDLLWSNTTCCLIPKGYQTFYQWRSPR